MADQATLDSSFARRVLYVVAVVLLAVVLAYLLRRAGYVLLLSFAGVLLAVALDGLTTAVQRYIPLRRSWVLLFILLVLLVLIGTSGALLGPYVADQMTQLGQRLPEAVDHIRSTLQASEWGRTLLRDAPAPSELLPGTSDVIGHITGAFSTALGAIANVFVMLVVGVFVAVSPDLYTKSVLYLVPPNKRGRAQAVLRTLGQALRQWFIGRLASMAVVGVLTYLGLALIGVPLALALGLITGILSFVPYLGPILALIPILLLAFAQSPMLALYAFGVYGVVQLAESNLITPLIQQWAVSIPPAYLVVAQVLGGVLAGALGVLLAAPLAVVIAVMIQMLYIEDVLGDSVTVLGKE